MVAAGSVLGARYVLRQPLGDDRVVWRADDLASRQAVAVRFLVPPDGDDPRADPQAAARFLAQARALSQVEHPNVVRVIDHGDDGGLPYLVMPYVLGEPLSGLLSRGGRLDPPAALALLAAVAEGLHAAGTAGVGHAELGPSDVILRLDGVPVLVGLGGAAADSSAMVRAAGRLTYQCLTGAPPPADAPAGLAEPVRTVLARALSTDASHRFPDPLALAAAARQAVGLPAQPVEPVTPASVRPQQAAPPAADLTVRSKPQAPAPPADFTDWSEPPAAPVPAAAPGPLTPAPGTRRRPAPWRPALAAALVLVVIGTGTAAAYTLGLTPWVEPLAGGGPTRSPGSTGTRTTSAPARTATPSPTTAPSPTPTDSPVATDSPVFTTTSAPVAARSAQAGGGSGGGNPPPPPPPPPPAPPPQQFNYHLAPLAFSPVSIDGSCVFRVIYGDYGVPFAEFHQFGGDCGTPTLRVAALAPNGDWGWQSIPQHSGTSPDCGGSSWRRVVAPQGWHGAFGVEIAFPRTGNTYTYGAFGSGTAPAYRSC